MKELSFIDSTVLREIVKKVLTVGRDKKQSAVISFNKNVIDPFTTLFDAAISELDHDGWKANEMMRQCQKALTNHIGSMHQQILGNISGWCDLGTGGVVDLINEQSKIIAEVKNKYNTLSGGKLAEQYWSLERLISPKTSVYKGFTAYFVNIIPKTPHRFDLPFTPSDKERGLKCPENPNIRIIDGASFYALATGQNDALQQLFDLLPYLIEDIYQNDFNECEFSLKSKEEYSSYFQMAFDD